jgi:ADP-dependent NAD(P)H-hydrate dehydratase / NAD(P)H-hydrate epimerase
MMDSKAKTARQEIQSFLVSAAQMQQIEQRIFAAEMPVAALMEKVSGRIVQWFLAHCEQLQSSGHAGAQTGAQTGRSMPQVIQKIGVLAGPGHNGGDALVVARELHYLGFEVRVYQPFARCKPLTQQHADYARSLGIAFVPSVQSLAHCDAIIDGWFGFGLTRLITDELAGDIDFINQQPVPIFSIDLPSGIHTDTGQVMGTAIKASYTACLGLWKRGFMQESAIAYLGTCDLIDFDIPLADIAAVLGARPAVQRLSDQWALAQLPLQRSPTAHKYKAGHLLLIAGSRQYAGAALLSGLGAMASGVGMLTLAVPESIRLTLLPQLPGALLLGCDETAAGAIASLPAHLDLEDLEKYDAIAFGPGLTSTVPDLLGQILSASCPLLLDADGLNLLAQANPIQQLQARTQARTQPQNGLTVLTPHAGEFKRLFPDLHQQYLQAPPGEAALKAAEISSAIILLKGPRSAVAQAGQPPQLWLNPHSTHALARGGSGDVLTGLMGGLMAAAAQSAAQSDRQAHSEALTSAVLGAVWWHSKAAMFASEQRTLLGVDPLHLAQALNPALQAAIGN